ncbi:MAG TPA: (2Fe-2S) ferredoxin domain-containing protein [Bacteroidales bacterium]|mgnify:CR=1 FL=1|nr:(2Fe-2S) ferredoxin domain-containing protein [Bacteroidales bacterium]HQL70213.1 (2Fe-2S) ferredoxin domain-containing protein [Bacteroidales bacterium]
MAKITSLEELRRQKEALQNRLKLRETADHPEAVVQVRVGMATSGIASGAKQIMEFMIEELEKRNIEALVTQAGDMGYCFAEPTVEVTRPGEDPVVFGYVDKKKADEIIEKYIKTGELIEGIIPANYHTINENTK